MRFCKNERQGCFSKCPPLGANMTTNVVVYSKIFMDEQDDSWCARPSRRLLEWLHGQEENSARWIAVLGGIRICLGDPVRGTEENARELFVPQWLLDASGFGGDGDEIRISFERSETLGRATKLGFKVLGDIPDDLDLKDLLEEPLSQLGVLEEGMILPVPVLEGVHLLVQTCEPAGQPVFLDGADIALEMEDDDAVLAARKEAAERRQAAEQMRTDKEAAERMRTEQGDSPNDDMAPMTPMSPFLPAPPMAPAGRSRGYIPFQGVGRRLCDE